MWLKWHILFCCFRSSVSFSFSSCWAPARGFLRLTCRSSTEVSVSGPWLPWKAAGMTLSGEELDARQRQWGGAFCSPLFPWVHFVLTPFWDACRIVISWLKSPHCGSHLVFYVRSPSRKTIQSASHRAWETVAELKKEGHRSGPYDVNAKLLCVLEWRCQTMACRVGLRSDRVTAGMFGVICPIVWWSYLGYFISATPTPKNSVSLSGLRLTLLLFGLKYWNITLKSLVYNVKKRKNILIWYHPGKSWWT